MEQIDSVISKINVMVDPKALKKLKNAYWNNIGDFTDACRLLETKVVDTITEQDVDKYVNYTKPIYASEVINSFLTAERGRWKKLHTLITELGESYAVISCTLNPTVTINHLPSILGVSTLSTRSNSSSFSMV